jgi:hypothetical protein
MLTKSHLFFPGLTNFEQPLVQTPLLADCEISVIVPVRNEAATLISTLTALTHQVDFNQQKFNPSRYEIILLANNCSDDSVAIATQFAQLHPELTLHIVEKTLPLPEAYIGRVRQLLMNEAYLRLLNLGRKRGIIASTDGDSQVSPTWLAATVQEIVSGADAVGGRIMLNPTELEMLDPYAKRCHLQEVGYRSLIATLESYLDPAPYDPAPRHFQHYGASFAVTVEAYARAGGLPAVRSSEDVALYRALVRSSARFRHSPAVRVTTSARPLGRAERGLANQLNRWAVMGQQQQPFLVESAAAIRTQLQSRFQLRRLWEQMLSGHQPKCMELQRIADQLCITLPGLQQQLALPQTFGSLFEQIENLQQQEGHWAQQWELIPIAQAIQELRVLLAQVRSL